MIPIFAICFLAAILFVWSGIWLLRNNRKVDYQDKIFRYYRGGYEHGYEDGQEYLKQIKRQVLSDD